MAHAQSLEGQASKLRTVYGAADAYGLNYFTLRRWLEKGRIPHVKVGRRLMVSDAAIREFLDAHRVPARVGG